MKVFEEDIWAQEGPGKAVSYGVEAWTLTKKEEVLLIFEGKYLEEYMALNMKTGNGKVGRIEN